MPLKPRKLLICDLDGTLIDSSDGILKAMELAFTSSGFRLADRLTKNIIGPPLEETLSRLLRTADSSVIKRLKEAFVKIYDSEICELCHPFEGINEMLKATLEEGHVLALATNKRNVPTQKILKALHWQDYFGEVETSDLYSPKPQAKSTMLKNIVNRLPAFEQVFYLGDTEADVLAAQEAGVSCLLAEWGYGELKNSTGCIGVANPKSLLKYL